ncbi:MAG: alpha/beta fold hydrolase [Acidobacteria bacterium]|nr:alpha/beta fold hydrolase [Acidobacteriota bacterium]
MRRWFLAVLAAALAMATPAAAADPDRHQKEGDFILRDFHFASGETLPELKIHYLTLGEPARDKAGHVTNAVLILHGTGGSGRQFLRPQFADVLFASGGLLDPATHFIILPDGIGHGGSSKPSDGLHARFPHYTYTDMIEAQHRLAVERFGAPRLRLVMGTSMGCMHAFMWGETFPDAMEALMPLACLPVPIAGRNRLWRKMTMDAIREDPGYAGGDYTAQPGAGLRTAVDFLILAGAAPLPLQKELPTRDAADAYLAKTFAERVSTLDANDLLYQVDASREYDSSLALERIAVPLMWVNSADDFINPPELGIAEREVTRVKRGTFVLIPASEATHGHGTHTWAAIWKDHLAELLRESEPR